VIVEIVEDLEALGTALLYEVEVLLEVGREGDV
jgi:hypothetical protein